MNGYDAASIRIGRGYWLIPTGRISTRRPSASVSLHWFSDSFLGVVRLVFMIS